MKQTAVEWLFDQLDFELELYNSQWVKLEQTFEKAKEMEKQQQGYSDEEVLEITKKLHTEIGIQFSNEIKLWVIEQFKKK